jgi:PleD family two-component response regulator
MAYDASQICGRSVETRIFIRLISHRVLKAWSNLGTNGRLHKPVGFEGSSVTRARVFLADDNEEILERVALMLASEFAVVGAVLDGLALLDAVARLQPEVVVLDIAMSVLNGLEAVERVPKRLQHQNHLSHGKYQP